MQDLAKQAGVDFVDTAPAFDGVGAADPSVRPYDQHGNEIATAIIAATPLHAR